jgi:TRAP-type C4-dicarboxylate transport system permease small subunit
VVSQSQGYTLAKNAGLSDSRAKLAAAIMMAAIVNGLLGFLPGAVPGVSTSIGVLDTVTKVGGAVTNTARWVSNPKNWVRVAYVIGGGILVYAAVESLILPYTTKAVGKVMGVVGPRGKVSKVAGAAKKLGEKANS